MNTPVRPVQRKKRKIYPTPRIEDVLLIEERDAVVEHDIVYGAPHPETSRYPDHRLIHVEGRGEDRQVWTYAADRERQEHYNYQITYPYAGLTSCPRIQRTLVVPRNEYRPGTMGDLDPLSGSADPAYAVFQDARLVLERLERISEQFDSRYVTVTKIFEKIPTLTEQYALGAEISYPAQGVTAAPQVTRRLVVPRDSYSALAKGTPDPVYTTAVLVRQNARRFDDPLSDSRYVLEERVYRAIESAETQTLSVELNHAPPDRFVTKTQIVEGAIRQLPGAGLGTISANDPTQTLAEARRRVVPDGDMEKALYQLEVLRTQYDVTPLTSYELDPYTGAILPVTQQLVPAGTAGSGVDSNGFYSEVEPYNARWSIKTTRKVTSLGPVNGRTWETHLNYLWPAVLLDFWYWTNPSFGQFADIKEAYSGPCRATITETFHASPPSVPTPVEMHPTSATRGPVSIPYSLHRTFPRFYLGGLWAPILQRTNFIDWPPTMQRIDVEPYKGGYKRTITTYHRPDTSTLRDAPGVVGYDVWHLPWKIWQWT